MATWAPSPKSRICSSLSLQHPLRSFNFPWRQQAAVRVAAARPLMQTTGKKMRQTQKKLKKPTLLAEEISPRHGNGGFEDGEVYVNDELGDGDKAQNDPIRREKLKEQLTQILSNAQRLKRGSSRYPARYTLGIDFGDVRTGVAISKGFAPRPVEVVQLRGQKLETRLIEIAERERAIEFVVGLPKSSKGLETSQSGKTRCFAGRLAVLAAQRGWCVYLHDEFGTSNDALDYMLMVGSTRKGRRTQLDAYAAVVLLQAYFDSFGEHAELVVPKKLSLQECLCEAQIVSDDDDDDDDEYEEEQS